MIGKRILAALVGAIIIFVWQAVSWMVAGIHDDSTKYHPNQDQIIQSLSSQLTEEGTYMIPTSPKNATQEQQQVMMEQMKGKPMASITYIKSYNADMAMPMIRGFLVNVLLVFLLIYIVTRNGIPSAGGIMGAALALGLFTWLWGPYMGNVWFQVPWDSIKGHLFDAIIAWGLCGLWLGWFLNRRRSRA